MWRYFNIVRIYIVLDICYILENQKWHKLKIEGACRNHRIYKNNIYRNLFNNIHLHDNRRL